MREAVDAEEVLGADRRDPRARSTNWYDGFALVEPEPERQRDQEAGEREEVRDPADRRSRCRLYEQQQQRADQRREQDERQQGKSFIALLRSPAWLPHQEVQAHEREHAEQHQQRVVLDEAGLQAAEDEARLLDRPPPSRFTRPSTRYLSIRCDSHDERIVSQPEPFTAPSTTLRSNVHRPRRRHGAADHRRVVQLVDVVLVRQHAVRPGEPRRPAARRSRAAARRTRQRERRCRSTPISTEKTISAELGAARQVRRRAAVGRRRRRSVRGFAVARPDGGASAGTAAPACPVAPPSRAR